MSELHEQIRRERVEGALLGELLNRYSASDVVDALGIPHVAGSLGVSTGCHFCGSVSTNEWMYQGAPTRFCYDCWERRIGTGDEDIDDGLEPWEE